MSLLLSRRRRQKWSRPISLLLSRHNRCMASHDADLVLVVLETAAKKERESELLLLLRQLKLKVLS